MSVVSRARSDRTISSRSNPAIREILRLRRRKDRDDTGRFFVEGIRIVGEAVDLRVPIEQVVVAPDLLRSEFGRELVHHVRASGVSVLDVTPDVFESISVKEGPQGIGAVVRQRWERLEDVRLAGDLCWVALSQVADPGNLGTILRTSDAVGGSGVMLVGPSTDPHDPSSLRASMGAIFSQRLVRATFDELADWKRRHGYFVVGTSDRAIRDYRKAGYPIPLALYMGSEREGLSADEQKLCDELVRIPMIGHSDSLNLAVATGVMLYEIFNQQRRSS